MRRCFFLTTQLCEIKAENDEFVRQCAEGVAVRVERLVRGLQQARRKQVGTSETNGHTCLQAFGKYYGAFRLRSRILENDASVYVAHPFLDIVALVFACPMAGRGTNSSFRGQSRGC